MSEPKIESTSRTTSLPLLTPLSMYIQVIDDPKNRKIFLVQELMEGGALMPDSEKCDAMTNEVRES